MIIIVMGVAGSGKTVVSGLLAMKLGWDFLDADDYHPQANIEKMRRGEPLSDDDRMPWLSTLHGLLAAAESRGTSTVLACSALRRSYRDILRDGLREVAFVYLKAEPQTIAERLSVRRDHFFNAALLQSQLDLLEPPDDALVIDSDESPEVIVDEIIGRLELRR